MLAKQRPTPLWCYWRARSAIENKVAQCKALVIRTCIFCHHLVPKLITTTSGPNSITSFLNRIKPCVVVWPLIPYPQMIDFKKIWQCFYKTFCYAIAKKLPLAFSFLTFKLSLWYTSICEKRMALTWACVSLTINNKITIKIEKLILFHFFIISLLIFPIRLPALPSQSFSFSKDPLSSC